MRRSFRVLVLSGGLAAAAGSIANASTANANLTVQATVSDTCSVADAALTFGSVNPTTGTAAPVTANIAVTCTLGTAFSVGLDDGQNLSGGSRRMRRGSTTDYLKYELYKDLLMTTRFGDTGSSDRASGLGLGITSTPVTVYGSIPSSQSVGSGSYADTVQITLYY
jgi:spore coat protein U-like protein